MSNDNGKPRDAETEKQQASAQAEGAAPQASELDPPGQDGIHLLAPEDDEDVTDDLQVEAAQTESALEARLRQVSAAYVALQDEMQAFRERNDRLQEERARRGRGEVVMAMFEPVQNLRRSVEAWSGLDLPQDATQGLTLVHAQFQDALVKLGLEEITAAPAKFDPNIHHAICTMPVGEPRLDGQVIQVFEAGYRVGTMVIQAARVIIGRYEAPVPPEEEAEMTEVGAEE